MTPRPQSSGKSQLACFGEILLRLSAPRRQMLSTAQALDIHHGGAEANVAVALARLGHRTRLVSALPDGPLGDGAITFFRGHGVDIAAIGRAPGRMGLYFLSQGASLRPSDIVYDRADSLFALMPPESWDWPALFNGCGWLHLSGITPALGPGPAQAALAAARAAKSAGMRISFDGNYRARLWESWDSDPRAVLQELVSHADLFFGNYRDIALLLDRPFSGEGPTRRREAAEAAFAAFPNLQRIASTARHVEHVDCHRIAARIDTWDGATQTEEVRVPGIVDRIGGGDAFAAGLLHGLLAGRDDEQAVHSGLALTCLKHSLPGDAATFGQQDIDAFLAGGLDVRR
ncbi:2-keto-3-deoxygluconate kinase [Sphingomonas oleivorans]|uniref:2-keto-3-deoxygluconate kinase n=1 Tax=Sphingomonas oleivorans TaxID=1735121 RepID=A0A2T5FUL7_9SPHN|nr:sugar kinase [Sphingomonas oleivorans]PTQ08217.1 2-keto-3-deoxygluconate kinase [Sphingomonas oleivorans]